MTVYKYMTEYILQISVITFFQSKENLTNPQPRSSKERLHHFGHLSELGFQVEHLSD